MRLGIVSNPLHAGTHRAHHRLVTLLDRMDVPYRTMSTSSARPGAWQADQLVQWGAEAVVALGGDGTLRAVAPAIAAAGVPLLVVPTGTANVFAHGLGVHSASAGLLLCEDFLLGAAARLAIPVSVADCTGARGRHRREHFLSLAGIGGDARAVAGRSRDWGLLGYVRGAVGALFAAELEARVDGEQMRAWSVMAAKIARPAGPIPVFPGAEVGGEDLECLAVVFGTDSSLSRLGAWARIGVACLRGHPERDPVMRYWTGRRATITADEPAPVQLDGDHLGEAVALTVDTGELLLDVVVPAGGGRN